MEACLVICPLFFLLPERRGVWAHHLALWGMLPFGPEGVFMFEERQLHSSSPTYISLAPSFLPTHGSSCVIQKCTWIMYIRFYFSITNLPQNLLQSFICLWKSESFDRFYYLLKLFVVLFGLKVVLSLRMPANTGNIMLCMGFLFVWLLQRTWVLMWSPI